MREQEQIDNDENISQQINDNKQNNVRIEEPLQNEILQQNSNKNDRWKNKHRLRYLLFLKYYQKELEMQLRQKMKWYSRMSDVVDNTNSQNCRMYHTGYLYRFKTIKDIINYLEVVLSYKQQNIQEEVKRFNSIISNLESKKRKQMQSIFKQELNSQKFTILNYQSINSHINIQTQSIMNVNNSNIELLIQQNQQQFGRDILQKEVSNISKKTFAKIPVQALIIVKRNTIFRDTNIKAQQQLINNIIRRFKNNNKNIRMVRKSKKKTKNQLIQASNTQSKKKESSCDYNPLKKKYIFWTKPQLIKLIIFLLIIKQNYQTNNHKHINKLNYKCSQYINTDKSPKNCKVKIKRLKQKYGDQFWNQIYKEAIKMQIPEDLVEKEKYHFNKKDQFKFQINIQCTSIQHKIQANQSKMHEKFKLIMGLNFVQQNITLEQKILQNCHNYQVQCKNIIKKIINLKISNEIFKIFKKDKKNNFIIKTKNIIILLKKTQQFIEFKQ